VPHVALRPWAEDDLALLQRLLGDPVMMTHLGGPESPPAIAARHQRYLHPDGSIGGVFAVVLGETPVGWIGYWETDWGSGGAWEAGWSVLPDFQRRGVATAATALLIERVRGAGSFRFLYAFPRVDNDASNALCRRLGFELLGEVAIEYPKGQFSTSSHWRLDLERAAP